MEILVYILGGLIGGVFGGMGMGGGTIIIPILTIFLALNQKIAQAYNLIAFLIMGVVAVIIHAKNKLISFKDIIFIIIFGSVFCVGGAYLAKIVDAQILKYVFAGFLILLSIFEFIKIIKNK